MECADPIPELSLNRMYDLVNEVIIIHYCDDDIVRFIRNRAEISWNGYKNAHQIFKIVIKTGNL